ncbi:MAG: copper chaperone PCu(A)C [Roseicyclus sp.]|nr:copper chaperone PCu(A)C [Roseicyclus sp.]
MTLKTTFLAAAFAVLPAFASAHMEIEHAVARVTSPLAQTAAVYFPIRNHSDDEDRLVRIEGDVADRIEIHTNIQDDNGVMRMVELEDGISIVSGGTHLLAPGGDHIMLLGLTEPLEQGDVFELLLFFDVYFPVTVQVTVDNAAVNELAAEAAEGGMDMDMDMDAEGEMDMEGGQSDGTDG